MTEGNSFGRATCMSWGGFSDYHCTSDIKGTSLTRKKPLRKGPPLCTRGKKDFICVKNWADLPWNRTDIASTTFGPLLLIQGSSYFNCLHIRLGNQARHLLTSLNLVFFKPPYGVSAAIVPLSSSSTRPFFLKTRRFQYPLARVDPDLDRGLPLSLAHHILSCGPIPVVHKYRGFK